MGNYRDSKDSAQLERFGITHIIAIHDAARKLHHVSININYLGGARKPKLIYSFQVIQ